MDDIIRFVGMKLMKGRVIMVIGINTSSSQSGRAFCADLMSRGYTVRGYSHESVRGKEFVNCVNSMGGLFLDRPINANNENKQFVNLNNSRINHNLSELVEHSDLIILAEPSIYFIDSVRDMIQCGLREKRVPLILSPSRTFSTPYLWRELGEYYPVVSFSTCPYSCKAPRPDTAYIKRRKRNWLASLEGEFSLIQIAKLGELFPSAIFNKIPATTSIGNIGAILHPNTYLLNYEEIQRRANCGETFSFYMDGIAANPEVGKKLEAVDQMRLKIAKKLGLSVFGLYEDPREQDWAQLNSALHKNEKISSDIETLRKNRRDSLSELNHCIPSVQHWLDYTYGVERIPGESLCCAIGRTPTYQTNSVPQMRYLDEDVATGLLPMIKLAERYGLDITVASELFDLCGKLYPERDRKYDRDLSDFSVEYIENYLKGSYFRVIE